MKGKMLAAMVMMIGLTGTALAQAPPAPSSAPVAQPAGKSLAATMNVYVFPNAGQAPEQQSKDEGDCYGYAVQQTGTDPFQLAKQADAQKQASDQASKDAQKAGEGAGAKGAVKGAAAGALIGAAAGDAGKGAAIGATAGVVAGRRKGKQAEAGATAQAQQQGQQAQAATAEQKANFNKAFSVCLEAKKYMVKY
jgi:hypothetical protein